MKSVVKKMVNLVKIALVKKSAMTSIKKMRSGKIYAKLTKHQIKEIQSFWLQYFGQRVNLKWHEYFYKVNGEFSPKYIPVYIKNAYIDPKLKNPKMAIVYSDKNMIDSLVGGCVKLPKSYVKNINGVYYIDKKVVTKEDAIVACQNIEDAVIKHTLESCQGKSILRFSCKNGIVKGKNCPETIKILFDQYEKDFIVQEAIQQSPEMAKLNPSSLNTIRIMTYWSKNDGVVPVFAVVRMGRLGSVVDNASAGGLYCGVNLEKGSLKEYAYTLTPFSSHSHTDSGVVLKNFTIPNFSKLKEKAVELHSYLPYTKLIGWDFSIDNNNEIVLVEINASNPGMFQAATGPAFGDYTEEILDLCR